MDCSALRRANSSYPDEWHRGISLQPASGRYHYRIWFRRFASGPAINAGISRWTERRASAFGGQNQTAVAVFGDSKSSPFYGVWLDAFREALDATYGIRCVNVANDAVAGTNSLSVLQRMQALGLGVANYIVIYCGVNDIQGGSPLSASIQNLSDMLDIVINEGGCRLS